ncbi:hypothetical protein B0H13DRAFT_2280891 [Mycena leptocephala]|nr:hypothetical protein B0H13DRAFT_2280891 [Mycena leptocephala]
MESLRSLVLYNITDLPDILTPHITKLAVKDPTRHFTSEIFANLIGLSSGESIRELDLLISPITNVELNKILNRCTYLDTFRLSSGSEVRTAVYQRFEAIARRGYLSTPDNRILEIQFSHHPPQNYCYAQARASFDSLGQLGTHRSLTITFPRKIYRFKVLTNIRCFDCRKSSSDMKSLLKDNDLDSAILVVDHSPDSLAFVLVLRDEDVANRIFNTGIWILNSLHKDISKL